MDTVLIDCNLPDSEEITKISWTHNQNAIQFLNDSNFTFLNDFELADIKENQSGQYECQAEARLKNYLTTIDLFVQEKPAYIESKSKNERVPQGESVIFDCAWWFQANFLNLNQSIENYAKWFINQRPLSESEPNKKFGFIDEFNTILKISDLRLEDSDTYSCIFTLNEYDVKISNFTLYVGGFCNFLT